MIIMIIGFNNNDNKGYYYNFNNADGKHLKILMKVRKPYSNTFKENIYRMQNILE